MTTSATGRDAPALAAAGRNSNTAAWAAKTPRPPATARRARPMHRARRLEGSHSLQWKRHRPSPPSTSGNKTSAPLCKILALGSNRLTRNPPYYRQTFCRHPSAACSRGRFGGSLPAASQ